MKLATRGIVFPEPNKGTTVDFSDVTTVKELKEKLVDYFVGLCVRCAKLDKDICKFSEYYTCGILEKVLHNYIDLNVKAIDTENKYQLTKFIKSAIVLIEIFEQFERWEDIYADERSKRYFKYTHTWQNSFYVHHLLLKLSEFAHAYQVVNIKRLKRFEILVEGDSEYLALPPIFETLGVIWIGDYVSGHTSVKFVNLEGKDNVQRKKIDTSLKKFREENVTYFIILDNDVKVKQYVADLERQRLIEKGRYLIWKNTFEDNFSENIVLEALQLENPGIIGKVDVKELVRVNSKLHDVGRALDKLLYGKVVGFKFKDYKVKIAQRMSEWVCHDIYQSSVKKPKSKKGQTSKKFTKFVKNLRTITDEIKRLSFEFHMVKE